MANKKKRAKRRTSREWDEILTEAAAIVRSYDTGVTLRQLYYRLVSVGLLANKKTEYTQLSSRTAEARRKGWFPELVDRTRAIHRYGFWESPIAALTEAAENYRCDRTGGQPVTLYIGVEKATMVNQLLNWFGDYGIPILALGGYSSQTYVDEVFEDAGRQDRPAVLVYAGDFDPSGEDIQRDFEKRGSFETVERVAIRWEQVEEFNLPPLAGKDTDTRAQGFIEKHGALVQVELEALPPDILRGLYLEAVARYFDKSTFTKVTNQEIEERSWAKAAVKSLSDLSTSANDE